MLGDPKPNTGQPTTGTISPLWRVVVVVIVVRRSTLGRLLLNGLLAAVLALSAVLRLPEPAHAAAGVQFGIDEGYKAPGPFQQSGATWDRINFFWESYQPTGPADWLGNANSTDADVARDLAAGMTVVGVITNPPAWATRNGSVPSNLALATTDPNNYWAAFVHHLAADYAGRIDQWIIWNEPDVEPSQPGSSWAGSEDEFYLLLKTANLAATSANPNAKIIFAGTTYWSDVLTGRTL